MRLLVELSGEHPTFPLAELLAVFEGNGHRVRFEELRARLFLIDVFPAELAPADGRLDGAVAESVQRLAMTHRVSKALFSAAPEVHALRSAANSHALPGNGPFAVSAERYTGEDASPLYSETNVRAREVASALGAAWGARRPVSLDDPETVVRAVVTADAVHVGERLWENDRSQYEWRAPKNRPFFSPVSGHPKLMRAALNLARVPIGAVIYDPLCGTGGILIEAGLCGMVPVGSDVADEMVEGTRSNLNHFGVNDHHVFQADVRSAPERFHAETGVDHPDAIVTDLPYGQSATTKKQGVEKVARWTFEAIVELLPAGHHAVVGVGSKTLFGELPEGLRLVESHGVRVHGSRTRTYGLLRTTETS